MPTPERGDVIFLIGGTFEEQVIGIFENFNEERGVLTLKFPSLLLNCSGGQNPRIFIGIKKEMIRILTPAEVFEKMMELFRESKENLLHCLAEGNKEALRTYKL